MIGELPEKLAVDGRIYRIRTDFRDVLKIIQAFGDGELAEREKVYICLSIMYPDFAKMPQTRYEEAFKAAIAFVDGGQESDARPGPRTMDWEQDEAVLFAAVNRTAGFETRRVKYLHWWTFLGYFMEMSDGVFANVLRLRGKKAHGKKLEKWEAEYWAANKSLCVLTPKLTAEEQAEKDALNKLLG